MEKAMVTTLNEVREVEFVTVISELEESALALVGGGNGESSLA